MEIRIQGSKLLQDNFNFLASPKRYLIHCGGARSSKSFSILQSLIIHSLNNPGLITSIVRKTLPSLRHTILRDFKELMDKMGIWNENSFNMSNLIYTFSNKSMIEFFSVDESQKVRGRKRDLLYLNEVNEITQEDFRQLEIRTTGKIIMDYNPSDSEGWFYDLPDQKPEESILIHSTYKDNPFIEQEIVRAIEAYQQTDQAFWEIFGLGLRGKKEGVIFTISTVEQIPDKLDTAIGIDWGFNHPSVCVRLHFGDGVIYIEELLHESYLTTDEIVLKIKDKIRPTETIWCDSAEPDRIATLKKAGLNVKPAMKDVKAGIDLMRSHKLYVQKDALRSISDFRNYKWKMKADGSATDEPTKINDDACDAARYAAFNHLKQGSGKFDYQFVVM